MNKNEKLLDSLVFEYLKRMEVNSSVLFSVNRAPVCDNFFSLKCYLTMIIRWNAIQFIYYLHFDFIF